MEQMHTTNAPAPMMHENTIRLALALKLLSNRTLLIRYLTAKLSVLVLDGYGNHPLNRPY
jgi:hypothetical protein